ncbi:homeobox protein 5-like isoform X2 [Battus philenor]|uniref:homeobox protein 5-like isoform X2 n=1 Tax=Battus philenor TaxID=42288 RepID=UPI0035CE9B06
MSGKPASVAASRAGVASVAGVAGAPRVLLYVAERQLEHAVAGSDIPPASALFDAVHDIPHQVPLSRSIYRHDQNDPRNTSGVIYKHFNDDTKCVFDENVTQRTEFFNVTQQFLKEPLKEDKALERQSSVKRDCSNPNAAEFSVETFQGRVPEVGEIATYQRCPISSENMPSMLPVALRHTENQFESAVQVSEGTNCGEREISMSKGYVNYQFLEQSASHQSIVNQSINILNQQVGVSRTIVSEGESCSAPQLVRTAEGVVLAVLPSPAVPQNSEPLEHRTAQSELPQTITVPLGWRRIVSGSSVLYISPSGSVLSTLPQLREYLQTAGTCKCGLPCPLRPETAFNFDPKVVGKQYQPSAGPELSKLCNHKRKLLATLQARAQSPATPPPHNLEQKKGPEVAAKKKMKKRGGYISNMNVSTLMVQKDKPLGDFKNQEIESKRTVSPGTLVQRGNIHPCQPPNPVQQNVLNVVAQENDNKHEALVQRSSHYLTVNSGWITQQPENIDGQKQIHSTQNSINTPINVGLPVLGTNGQIIGVNTGFNKQTTNLKNVISIPTQSAIEQEHKVEKKELNSHIHQVRQQTKDDDSQIFCGLNQALTPEVMQKINEQQQIFIQQNQKQIEMAMKGFKTQLNDNSNHNKSHAQYVPQGQLVIQNGAVVKTNSAKTPPWQVKRNDSNTSMTSPSPKPQKIDNLEYDEQHSNVQEESSNSFNSFPSQDSMTQGMCSRVPPLPQHYNIVSQQWPALELNKKKTKVNNKAPKKNFAATENKAMFGNNGLRYVTDSKGKIYDDAQTNNVPSFMDDPNGYLAQQTVLLNNTISKQVGINSSYSGNQYDNSNNSYNTHNQNEKQGKQVNKSCEGINVFKNNMVTNSSPSPHNTPDSSLVPEKNTENSTPQCCKACNNPYKGNCTEYIETNMRNKYLKHNHCTMEVDGNSSTSSPKHGFDDNPVTSSTFIERNLIINENSGPIQAGVVSTSNVSPTDTLQPPEPSPTLSNSSRNTDTPHSSGSNNQLPNNNTFPVPSPAYSGTCRDGPSSNPSTPNSNHIYPYNSPGPPQSQSALGTQMMHFISNHNVNKNLMEVDNISMVGVKPNLRTSQDMYRLEGRKRLENLMPGYCPPPHLGGGPAHSLIQTCYVQTFVTTMASGFSVTRDTVTSVLAGKANTATTSINASQANFIRPPPPPSVNLATTYAIPTNQPDPFINAVNLPTSYPLHIAGTTAQNMISKSPLEMVQNVISSLPSKSEISNTHSTTLTQIGRRTGPTTPGQILISSTGQIIVSNNHMPPPPPKTTSTISPVQVSNAVTNVTTSVTQVVPAVGNVQPIVNQPTVVVNTLPAPFVLQPPMMAVDGQVMQPNAVLPQIVTGGIVSGQSNDSHRQIEVKNGQSFVQGMAMLSPETLKKRNKKKKTQAPSITNVLQIAAPQQNPNNIMVHHSSPQHNSSPQFSPRGFQLSPTNNISPTPMLQALTIVPGKSGTPAHIVMNGQGNANNFGSQQILTNTSPSQQINLLQPVNLINNTTSVMSNFPAFQQFIVPNLGGMVMTADGTAIIQDNSTGMPMQLQLQTVNGQNVLTPVQNTGVFTAGANSGVVLRAQNQQGKIIQSQHSPGAQFLSPNSQVMMNSPSFNGQLSPLLANLSPTNVTFNTSPHQVRTGNVQTQEFIQTNQMGQTLMVPLSPKQVSIASATNNRSNSTFVQQNTTIVQQQTTLVSNSHNTQMTCQTNLHGGNSSRLSIDPNLLLAHKQITNQKGRSFVQISTENNQIEEIKEDKHTSTAFGQLQSNDSDVKMENEGYARFMSDFNPSLGHGTVNSHVRHSVSTQTLVNQQRGKSPNNQAVSGSSPPDTTTHSPLGALETASSPRVYGARCMSTQGNYADTTTKSPEPADMNSSGMVQCVSSSEQDMAESRERAWPTPRNDVTSDNDTPSMISNVPIMRQNRALNPVETSELHYNQNMNAATLSNQHVMPVVSNYYDRAQSYKRKNEFGDGSSYRTDKIMRTNYSMVHGMPKDEYDSLGMSSPEKSQRHFATSGTSSGSPMQKVFDRHNLGSGDGVEN